MTGHIDNAAVYATTRADLLGAAAMAGGNVLLIVNDTAVKLAASQLPMSEVIALRASGALLLLLALTWVQAPGRRLPRLSRMLFWRGLLEAVTSFAYLYALQLLPIAELAGLQLSIPLAILVGGTFVFGEQIGRRGWFAVLAGLAGALLIVRPGFATGGAAASTVGVLLAVLSVVFSVGRELLTRALPAGLPPAFVAGTSQAAMLLGALSLAPFDHWAAPAGTQLLQLGLAVLCLAAANTLLVVAMRSGRLAVVAPFRYAGLLAALVAGFVVWNEFPPALSLLGSAIIVGAGLARLWSPPPRPSPP